MHLLLRALASIASVGAAIYFVPGITPSGSTAGGAAATALCLALVNLVVKPIAKLLSLPLNFLTLGLFGFVINALMLILASFLARHYLHTGIEIENFSAALIGSIIISIVGAVTGVLLD
ncbi:MAG: phage holin family protein [Atopobiaceae bacterium]|nr:phage holin family protein [Atopobiaceae bacterium]